MPLWIAISNCGPTPSRDRVAASARVAQLIANAVDSQSAMVLARAGRMTAKHAAVTINRAPVLTLRAAVVAERLGFDRDEALTCGRAVAEVNAYSKGVALGLFEPMPQAIREQRKKARPAGISQIGLLGRAVPATHTPEGVRATAKDSDPCRRLA